MSRPLLIAAPKSDPYELTNALARLQRAAVILLPAGAPNHFGPLEVHRVEELSADAIVAAAREHGAQGAWSDDPAHAAAVASAAARLHWPHQESGGRAQTGVEALLQLLRQEAPVVNSVRVQDASSAAEAAQRLGLPLLVRAAGSWGQGACQLVEHEADLPLAIERARKAFPHPEILLQQLVEGPVYRVAGFKVHREFYPADLVREEPLASACGVSMEASLPSGLSGELFTKCLALSRRVVDALPHGSGYLEVELVLHGDKPLLSNVSLPPRPHPAHNRMFELGLGLNLLTECLRTAGGDQPRLSPSRDLGVAVSWIRSRSGLVEDISHTREALAMEGIHSLHIEAQPGQTLGHIVDITSRDRIGYVVAVRPTRPEAEAVAQAARQCIDIVTKPIL